MKVNSGQAPSTLIPEYLGSDFDKVASVANNLEYVKQVAEGIAGLPVKSYAGPTPPTRPVMGSEWYCTTDGRTYIWYEDEDSSQWVESSPQSTNDGLLQDLDTILDPKYKQISEALRRSYAEAGYTLVSGSFEKGGTLNSNTDVLLYEGNGDGYSWSGAFPKVVAAGSTPTPLGAGSWVDCSDVALRGITARKFSTVTEMISRGGELIAGDEVSVTGFSTAGDGGAGKFLIVSGTSAYPLINPDVGGGLYAKIIPQAGEFTTSQAGCQNGDCTLNLRQAMLYAVEVNAILRQNSEIVLKTPLDDHTFIRLPQNSSFVGTGTERTPITIHPQSGVTRDAGICLETFAGLAGAKPAMCVGTQARDIWVRCITTDGGDVKVGTALIAAMFNCSFINIRATNFQRHGILVCRCWYAHFGKLFGAANRGSGVTLGKHPDVNPSWLAELNACFIDEIWGHSNGSGSGWTENTSENIGYGVGTFGTLISVSIGKIVAELNVGAGFQNSFTYGSWNATGMYIEANTGPGFYSNVTASSGIAWECRNISLLTGQRLRIKPDSLTDATIGIPFAAGSNTVDVTDVRSSQVKVDRNTIYTMRNALASLFRNYVVFGQENNASLTSFTTKLNGLGPATAEINNNYELVFVPTVTTTSTSNFGWRIWADGEIISNKVKAGPFTAYQEVILDSWSGLSNAYYSMTVTTAYGEACAGTFILRAKML